MQASNGEISGPTHIIEADPISRNAPRQKQDFIYQKTVLSLTSSSSNCSGTCVRVVAKALSHGAQMMCTCRLVSAGSACMIAAGSQGECNCCECKGQDKLSLLEVQ